MNLYGNDFFSLETDNDKVYILVEKVGYEIRDFNKILEDNSRIHISNFLSLKRALGEVSGDRVEVGVLKSEIEIFISNDDMICELKVNFNQEYIDNNLEEIHNKMIYILRENNIKKGIDTEVLMGRPISGERLMIAKGVLPVEGESAKVKYFARADKRIEIKKDGKADYYNLNLIDGVKRGDWLGEKTPALMGQDGFTVKGGILPATMGRDEPFIYDEKSIRAYKESGKIVLRALNDGAVSFQNHMICVQGHLIIDEDVDFSVGNIDFDGHVTIKGIVKDGFSVSAVRDISILGEIGIGTAGKISSSRGSVYIKGGINGKGVTEIYADQNVYVKYANETTITAGREINIGYYAIACNLYGDRVLIDGLNGRLISGSVYVKSQVIAGVIGNVTERETNINVHGFNRFELRKEYEDILGKYKELLVTAERLKGNLNKYKKIDTSNDDVGSESTEYNQELREYERVLEDISYLNQKRIQIQGILTSKGEGEVSVLTGIHPKTHLELKNMKRNIEEFTKGSFYVKNSEIHFDAD